MCKKINESNFKVLCLKDDNESTLGLYYFNKYDILEFKNGFTIWLGNFNKPSFEYKSFEDLLNRNQTWKNGGYFELIEVDGQPISKDDSIHLSNDLNKILEAKWVIKDGKDIKKPNSKQFNKLWDSGIINSDLITLNWGDEKQFFEAYKNNEGLVYIDENIIELNYEQCVELYKWLQRVVSFVDNNKEIDMTKEQIEKELGHKINIVE